MAAPGRLITIEGGEGAGKSSLIRSLAARLKASGRMVVTTREPGGTEGADQIRALLVTGDVARWSSRTELLLALAARSDHLERVILPALAQGHLVICDRFTDSTRVYQGMVAGQGRSMVDTLSRALGIIEPDLTLVLDVTPEVGLARAMARGADEARFERRGIAFHNGVREAFLALADQEPQRMRVLDALRSPDAVLADALEMLGAAGVLT